MKKLIYLIALLTAIQACKSKRNNTTSDQIIFNGTANKIYNGQKIILRNNSLGQTDTAKIVDGKFQFKIPFKEATRYRFYNYNKAKDSDLNSICDILVAQPGSINIKANVVNLKGAVVTGASDNKLYTTFLKFEIETRQQIDLKLAEKYGKDYIKHFEPGDLLYKDAMAYYEKLARVTTVNTFEFVQKNANSFAAIYMLQTKVNEINPDTLELLYNKLGHEYKKTRVATIIKNKIRAEKATAIGRLAPDFEQADTSGKAVKLSSFRGKFVLIDFWASWCGPCREENPNLLKAYRKFRNKGFTVLGVSLDSKEDKDKWLAAIHQDKLEWQQLSDLQFWKNSVAITYGITYIPQNFLIGPDGKIVAKSLMGEDLNKKLQELLSTKR